MNMEKTKSDIARPDPKLMVTQYIAHGIARYFEVSDQVIEKRLIREYLWPH
jgi:Zn-dependent peptidase ImmA (M78 family)